MSKAPRGAVYTWADAVKSHGIEPVIERLEDRAADYSRRLLVAGNWSMQRAVWLGLPVLLPQGDDVRAVEFSPDVVGQGVYVSCLLAGLAVCAHATESLYIDSNPRFYLVNTLKTYRFLLQTEALRSATASGESWFPLYEDILYYPI